MQVKGCTIEFNANTNKIHVNKGEERIMVVDPISLEDIDVRLCNALEYVFGISIDDLIPDHIFKSETERIFEEGQYE